MIGKMDKAQLRRELMECLLGISPEQRSEKSRKACNKLISTSHFQEASTIMMFVSLPHEVDTSEAILHAWQLGKIVAAPKISW
ncbi:MAG: 5-formyltetrahydrofolate cyclo-ligase, partial [Planctomycetota bacterium]|nr:5-formyltetrahydrofolate cyclo-ligase [Planctomycetota bacterium]